MSRVTCPTCTGSFQQSYGRMHCCSTYCYLKWVKKQQTSQRLSVGKIDVDYLNNLYRVSGKGYQLPK